MIGQDRRVRRVPRCISELRRQTYRGGACRDRSGIKGNRPPFPSEFAAKAGNQQSAISNQQSKILRTHLMFLIVTAPNARVSPTFPRW